MSTRSKAAKQEVISKHNPALEARANEIFKRAVELSHKTKKGIAELGGAIAQLRAGDLWKHITTRDGQSRFRSWVEVVKSIYGPMADRKLYELSDCHSLTQGTDPISAEEVEQYGVKRAVEIARLKPEQRTPEIRKLAQTEPVMVVRNKVQAILNQDLPKDEQKPMLKLVAINLPEDIAQELEDLIEVMGYTEGCRDGDTSIAIRAKAVQAIIYGAQQYWIEELAEALKRMRAEAGKDASPAAEDEEWSDFPDKEDEFAVPAANEDAKSQNSKFATVASQPKQLGLMT